MEPSEHVRKSRSRQCICILLLAPRPQKLDTANEVKDHYERSSESARLYTWQSAADRIASLQ